MDSVQLMQDTLKMSSYGDMQDWMDRDSKLPPVILNDKLMTDAIIGGSGMPPIKTEHSYSLNSDGDSISDTLPDSPHSMQNKMDDMEEECYPAISMNGHNKQHLIHRHPHLPAMLSAASGTVLSALNSANFKAANSPGVASFNLLSTLVQQQSSSNSIQSHQPQLVLGHPISLNNNHLTINNNLTTTKDGLSSGSSLLISSGGISKRSCSNDSSSSSSGSVASDIEIEEFAVKEEPMSPGSSCPPSPSGAGAGGGTVLNGYSISTVNLASLAASTQSDLVLDHKNVTLQLTPASHSLLKSQQIVLNGNTICTTSSSNSIPASSIGPKIVMSKLNIKMEPQSSSSTTSPFGLPPTPPSSLPSDESEGNQSPEHHTAPMSPPNGISAASPASSCSSSPSSRRTSVNAAGNSSSSQGLVVTTARISSSSSSQQQQGATPMTRQPIHTPLISSQPKGSTGTLILTEEEKRTLLAEGYPIPTRLPLTKAEEKSLKKIRRKIKNKISAQESRRKKKEYMDQLERRVEILVSENLDYRKRVESLEDSNQNLITELAKLRTLVASRQQAAAEGRKM
ncbi:cyclic AMP response element-binding protein A isoform X2 [Uranotaenia lowii]|uniref:cyclic AMP response element-binding protein A isoform X2 n=1 Tax=Uranotaenia lowii TaxID=190385 RepID=UPI0024790766|nr:cyclic AMP response element-binding protein A isoform X2 [Uranotaenia lowii]